MMNLVDKSLVINIDDQEYQKIKERIFRINNKSLPEDIFYEQRFNVSFLLESIFIFNLFIIRQVILFLKHLLICLVII